MLRLLKNISANVTFADEDGMKEISKGYIKKQLYDNPWEDVNIWETDDGSEADRNHRRRVRREKIEENTR